MLRIALPVTAVLLFVSVQAHAATPSPNQAAAGRDAFAAATAGDWASARRAMDRVGHPVAGKLLTWYRATRPNTPASFDEISRFISENPDWPSQRLLRQRAEEAMTADLPPRRIVDWFRQHEPITTEGRVRFARALVTLGERDSASQVARAVWADGWFSANTQNRFLDEFGILLGRDDHHLRIEHLVWQGRIEEANRLLPRVEPAAQALAAARIQLRQMAPGVDAAIARVPTHLQAHPGLVYERARWRRAKGRDDDARALLLQHPSEAGDPDLWWRERHILARRSLADGRHRDAYRVASAHGAGTSTSHAEAQWLSGWIALRFLNDPRTARRHFETMHAGVAFPISMARGAYWSGRAAEAEGDRRAAERWYRAATEHPATFYGQLAAARIAPDRPLRLDPDPTPSSAERRSFDAHDLTAAVHLLNGFGRRDLAATFLLHLAGLGDGPAWPVMTAALAQATGQPHLGVFIARRVTRDGTVLLEHGYPTLPVPTGVNGITHGLEKPLVLAIIRQESAYQVDAKSRAGALGLMQLMPATAQQVARQVALPYAPHRLVTDPDYNMNLGQAYMRAMLERFDGSYVLSLAAYNAGPGRSVSWRSRNGPPNTSVEEAIDWIEQIPFSETRNYVQRTLEHLQVYRTRVNGSSPPRLLETDLLR
ncbi:MAG: lytic transglycosylase domain-containing protein [Rhodospirillales bacterium]|nr:MAG: lytic transglycosylase domain-containing protein [Rhodospirillales bacterium]